MKKILLLTVLVGWNTWLFAQITYKGTFGDGVNFRTEDGTFGVKIRARIQPRWDFIYNETTESFQQQALVARSRLKFDGFMVNTDLRYKIEIDLVGGYMRDALVKYRFAKHSDLWFGQGKLPSNRERIVSSANMQFVNRSVTNNAYTLDRDVGIQFHHYFEVGDKMIIRDMYAVSAGSGIRNVKFKPKPSVTAKIEVLPMGFFEDKGDYSGGDLKREKTLKMAIAFSADYNMDAYKSNSHIGTVLDANRDLLTLNADMLLKYRGWSFMTEWGMRSTPNANAIVYDLTDQATGAYYTGWGLNAQTGYVFKNNWEIALRYSFTDPDDLFNASSNRLDYYQKITDHTVGVSKYIVGHKLKVQADVSYVEKEIDGNQIHGRLQMEFSF